MGMRVLDVTAGSLGALASSTYEHHVALLGGDESARVSEVLQRLISQLSDLKLGSGWATKASQPRYQFYALLLEPHVSVLTPERWDGGMKVLDADVTVHTGRAESRFAVLVTSFNNSPGHVTLVWADPNE